MPITLFLCFPKEGEEDRKGRGPTALSAGGAPPCSTVGPGVCSLSPAQSPSRRTHPSLQKKNSPRAPSLGRGKEKQLRLRTARDARPGPCLLTAPVLQSQERGGRDSRACYLVTLSAQGERRLLSLNTSSIFPRDRLHLPSKETKS